MSTKIARVPVDPRRGCTEDLRRRSGCFVGGSFIEQPTRLTTML
jgi:hypothetical protein